MAPPWSSSRRDSVARIRRVPRPHDQRRHIVSDVRWVPVAEYSASYEADIAVARLESAGILAVARGNDIVGVFGPGFGGASALGVRVLVPSDAAEAAHEILAHAAE